MTDPRPTCFVHIGAPKTGTTYLQKVMTANAPALAHQGLLYPSSVLRGYGHHDLAFLLNGGYPEWASRQPRSLAELVSALKAEVAGHKGNVLLSSEDFYLYPQPAKLRGMLEDVGLAATHDIRIIVYLRRQDMMHESWYNQTIKAQGYTHDLSACIAAFDPMWNYETALAPWAEAFGTDALLVRIYESGQFKGGGLLDDFAALLNIDARKLTADHTPVNTGLNRDLLEFQRMINHLPLPTERKRMFHKSLIDLSLKTAGAGTFDEAPLLSAQERGDILARHAAGNAAVAKMYLKQRDLFLEPVKPDVNQASASSLSAETVAMIVGWLLLQPRDGA